MKLAFHILLSTCALALSSSLSAQVVEPSAALRNLAAQEPEPQLKAQEQIIDALTGPDVVRRQEMLSAIKKIALGSDEHTAGALSLAMLSIALDRHPSSSREFISAFDDVYRNSPIGGIRAVAVWELVRHIRRPNAAKLLREIAANPVDRRDHTSMLQSMAAIGGSEVRLLAEEMAANKWVTEPLALMELRRLLGRPIPK